MDLNLGLGNVEQKYNVFYCIPYFTFLNPEHKHYAELISFIQVNTW